MADKTITLTVPEAKVAKALEGFLAIYPNTEKKDDDPTIDKYTNAEWVDEMIRRIVVRDIKRGLQIIANRSIALDDTMVNIKKG